MLKFYLRIVIAIGLAITCFALLFRVFLIDPLDVQVERLLGGQARMHAEAIAQIPPVERRAAVQRLESSLGFGVRPEQQTGPTKLHAEWRRGNLYLIAPVPESPGQLAFGPLPFRSPAAPPLVPVIVLALSALAAWVSIAPLMRRVRSIEAAAAQMCRGDFGVRTGISDANDMLDGIGGSLNQLAERIGQLLSDERDLLRTVAHEVRAPIARMRFRVERILSQVGEEASKDVVGLVGDLQRVDSLFDELLTYVAFDEFDYERPPLQTAAVEVYPAVQRLVDEVTSTDNVQARVHGSTSARVVANPKLFDRAVTNLLLNAMAYGEGRIDIHIREFVSECVIDVQDNGPGIPELDRPKVVKPFVRLGKKKTRGTGLGLAIVQRIMSLHQGRLHLVGAPGGGASIQLVWPNASAPRSSQRSLRTLFPHVGR